MNKQSLSISQRLANLLKGASLGKYHTKLYHRGETYSSSVLGGIFTIIMTLTLVVISFVLLNNALTDSKKNYQLKSTARAMENSGLNQGVFLDNMLDSSFLIQRHITAQQNCEDISLRVLLMNGERALERIEKIFQFEVQDEDFNYCSINRLESNTTVAFRNFMVEQSQKFSIDYQLEQNGEYRAPFVFTIQNIESIRDIITIYWSFAKYEVYETGLLQGWRSFSFTPELGKDIENVGVILQAGITLSKYSSTSSVFGTNFQDQYIIGTEFKKYEPQYFYNKSDNTNIDFSTFYETAKITEYTRQPESILTVLSKIGGLFALFRISMVFFISHIKSFERDLVKDLNSRKAGILNSAQEGVQNETQESLLIGVQKKTKLDIAKIKELFSFENFLKQHEKQEEALVALQELQDKYERLEQKLEQLQK